MDGGGVAEVDPFAHVVGGQRHGVLQAQALDAQTAVRRDGRHPPAVADLHPVTTSDRQAASVVAGDHQSFVSATSGNVPSCPVCLAPMVLKGSARASGGLALWGCGRYPGCRGTHEVAAGTSPARTPRQLAREGRRRRSSDSRPGRVGARTDPVLHRHRLRRARHHSSGVVPHEQAPAVGAGHHPAASASTTAPTSAPRMGEQPIDVAVDAKSKLRYTADYVSGDVTLIDTVSLSVVDTIDVAGKPVGIVVPGNTLYVADRAGEKVYAISLKTPKTTATFTTGRGPSDLARIQRRADSSSPTTRTARSGRTPSHRAGACPTWTHTRPARSLLMPDSTSSTRAMRRACPTPSAPARFSASRSPSSGRAASLLTQSDSGSTLHMARSSASTTS